MSDIPIFDDRRNLPEPKPPLEVLHPSPIVENPLLISPIDDIRKFEYEVIGGVQSEISPTEPITTIQFHLSTNPIKNIFVKNWTDEIHRWIQGQRICIKSF